MRWLGFGGGRVVWLALALVGAPGLGCGDDDEPSDDVDASVGADMGGRDLGRADGAPSEDARIPVDEAAPRDMGPVEPVDAGSMRDAGMLGEACDTPGASRLETCGTCGVREDFCLADGRFAVGACEGSVDEPLTGEPVSFDFDTRFAPAGLLAMPGCVDPFMPDMALPPHVVVPYVVPGSTRRELVFTTQNDGTDETYDTQIQIRRGSCEEAPTDFADVCFFGTATPDRADNRAAGVTSADGGDTVYFVVSGSTFGTGDRGRGRLDITTRAPTVPAIVSGRAMVTPTDLLEWIELFGTDAAADAQYARVTSLDGMGEVIDVNGDGLSDENDTLRMDPFNPGALGVTELHFVLQGFVTSAVLPLLASLSVTVVDAVGNESTPFTMPVRTDGVSAGGEWGGSCDDTHWCNVFETLTCAMGRCAHTDAALEAACAGGMRLALTTAMPSATTNVTIGPGEGSFHGFCGSDDGREGVVHVGVPEGRFDVIATTRIAGTPVDLATMLYIADSCGGSFPIACDAGFVGGPRAEVFTPISGPNDVTVIAELPWARGAAPIPETTFAVDVRLRPLVTLGDMCDPMGIANRCDLGTCTAGVCSGF